VVGVLELEDSRVERQWQTADSAGASEITRALASGTHECLG
jgi:hypothetical protein